MRFVFIGAGAIAARCIQLHAERFAAEHAMVGVVAPRDLVESATLAQGGESVELGLERGEQALRSVVDAQRPDVVISVQYPWILSPGLLDAVDGRVVNLHNARLPDYRGHNTISHEILDGERTHTATLHWVAEEVDRGAEIATQRVPIRPDDTAHALWRRSADACVSLFATFLADYGRLGDRAQAKPIPAGGTYHRKAGLAKLKQIPADADLATIDRIARAFWFPPHEPAFFVRGDRKVYVLPGSYEYKVNENDDA